MAPRTLFLADLHLRPGDADGEPQALERFVDTVAVGGRPADRLVLLGDVFHLWMEWRGRVVGDFTRALSALRRAADAGVAIRHVFGNRDYILGADIGFPGVCGPAGGASVLPGYGIRLEGRRFTFEQDGERIVCLHGDAFCTRDYRFRFLRWLTQGPVARTSFRFLPMGWFSPWVGWLQSRPHRTPPPGAHRREPAPRQWIQSDAWHEAAAAWRADRIICGHMHRAFESDHEAPGGADDGWSGRTRLTVVPSWRDRWYGELAGGHFTLRRAQPDGAIGDGPAPE